MILPALQSNRTRSPAFGSAFSRPDCASCKVAAAFLGLKRELQLRTIRARERCRLCKVATGLGLRHFCYIPAASSYILRHRAAFGRMCARARVFFRCRFPLVRPRRVAAFSERNQGADRCGIMPIWTRSSLRSSWRWRLSFRHARFQLLHWLRPDSSPLGCDYKVS